MTKQHTIYLSCMHQLPVRRIMRVRFAGLPSPGSRYYCPLCKEYRIVTEVRHQNVQGG